MSLPYGAVDHEAMARANDGTGAFRGAQKEVPKRAVFIPHRRVRVNALAIVVNIICPWLLCTALLWVMIFETHYMYPTMAWFAVFSGFGLSAVAALLAYNRKYNCAESDPMWYTYASIAFFAAALFAAAFGNWVFNNTMNNYYDFMTLNTYSGVNPQRMKGQMVMDAGRAYFSTGSHLDQKKTAAFKHGDEYCVVPIAVGEEKMPNYDFWAVGVNCCGAPGQNFHCGPDWDNFKARSGFREMDLEKSSFYRLAVQQAEAAYGITANHPVFFQWSQDPLKEIHKDLEFGVKLFVIGTFTHFIANFVAVVYAVFAFAKMTAAIS